PGPAAAACSRARTGARRTPPSRRTAARPRTDRAPRAPRRRAHGWWSGVPLRLRSSCCRARRTEYEIYRTQDAQCRPQVVEPERLVHVERRKRHEHAEGDHLLQDLQLRQAEARIADAVAGYLQQVLEEGDTPAEQRRQVPGAVGEVAQVRVPGEGHEDVGGDE